MTNFKTLVGVCPIAVMLGSAIGCGGGDLPRERQPQLVMVNKIRTGFDGAEADSESVVATASPTGFANLRGTFKISGPPPTLSQINSQIQKDTAVCAPGGKPVYDRDVVVDSATNGIANVVIFADGVDESWVHDSAKPGKTDEILFDQKDCVFLTRVVAMQTTQSMRATNSDPVGHNLKLPAFNKLIPSGGFEIYRPSREERRPLEMSCSIHPWMKAWLIPRDNSYFAVSKEDGSFEILNLPAGVELDFRIWQERIKAVTEVQVNGQPEKWSKGRMKLTLQPDTDTNLDVVIDSSLFN